MSLVKELKTLCQTQSEILLLQKQELESLKETKLDESTCTMTNSSLLFYKSVYPLFKTLDCHEILLHEIEEKIREKRQKKELKAIYNHFHNLTLDSDLEHPLLQWYHEMLKYCREWNDRFSSSASFVHFENCNFYNVVCTQTEEDSNTRKLTKVNLTFSTRFCGKCMTMSIRMYTGTSFEEEELSYSSSLEFEGTLSILKKYLREKTAEEFVREVIWKNIQELNEFD